MCKLLYVEDDRVNRFVLSKMLEEVYAVDTCVDGKECFRKVEEDQYNLILLDINLGDPELNGFDVIAKLKEDPSNADLKFIAVTAYDERDKFKTAGFDDFHIKPINKDLLLKQISLLLQV